MNTFHHGLLSVRETANAFAGALSSDTLHHLAPAVYAPSAHERTSAAYTFISTQRLLEGLLQAGFMPVDVRQARTRTASLLHARHVVRLRRRYETVQLRDAVLD